MLLASEGVTVFICGHDEGHLADALEQLNVVGIAHGMRCDLAKAGELDRFFAQGAAQLDGYDIAILNAAVPAGGLTAMSEQDVREAIAINFTGYLLGAHKAVRQMEAAGGDIILTGSYATHKLGPSSTVYAGIKAGIHGFAEALRREVGPQGIKVGLVVPGLTASAMTTDGMSDDEQRRRIAEDNMLQAEDIAAGVHFMLTRPRRTVVQELILVPRNNEE